MSKNELHYDSGATLRSEVAYACAPHEGQNGVPVESAPQTRPKRAFCERILAIFCRSSAALPHDSACLSSVFMRRYSAPAQQARGMGREGEARAWSLKF